MARGGVAIFSGLMIDAPADGYGLEVSGAGLHVKTDSFEVANPFEIYSFPEAPYGPNVLLMQVVKKDDSLEQIVVSFDEPMDESTVTNLQNYTLLDAGPDHLFGNSDDHVVRLKKASYHAATDSVTLTLKKHASLRTLSS